MQYKMCSTCMIEKPITLEFFGLQQKNHARFLTECKTCKKAYQKEYQENRRLGKDPDLKRVREMYVFKEATKEEKKERMRSAYAYIYYQAFDESISQKQLKEIEGIEE